MLDDEIHAAHDARLALLKAVKDNADGYPEAAEKFARAYRYLAGGPQPGSIEVKNG